MPWDFMGTERVEKTTAPPPAWSTEETTDGHLCRELAASSLPWYVGAATELWAKLCWLAVSGSKLSDAREDTWDSGHKRFSRGVERRYTRRWTRSLSMEVTVGRTEACLPLLQAPLLTWSPGNYGLLPTCTNPNMLDTTGYGLGRGGVGLAEIESPELCQRLGVAGGDKTKALECASWVPAVLAVRTGLGKRDSPWICFSRRRFSNCNEAHRHGQLPSLQ